MARNRIIYASQSVWCNGEVLYRVQSLGSTTTFTSEDIFELGHLDIVDVVDDVPAVAVTLNTNDFGDVRTLAILAQVASAKRSMNATATNSNANLVAVSGTAQAEGTYYHGVGLPDFAVTCGNLTGVSLWAPVQDECSLGTLADNIDQSMWMDEVYINSLEFSYTTGANATENYGAETDQKMWLLNDGKFVNFEYLDVAAETQMILDSGVTIATLSDGDLAFLRKSPGGKPAATIFDNTNNVATNVAIETGVVAATDTFVYNSGTDVLFFPTGALAPVSGDRVEVVYAGDAYASAMGNKYFDILGEADTDRPNSVGALRQGQVEVYIIDPDDSALVEWADAIAWRLTSATITSDLTREPLAELGHLGPYDRPLTLPIPITVTLDTTAGDLEHWARFAGKLYEFENDPNFSEIDLADLFGNENMILVVKVYAQTDEEAGGVGADRKVLGADNDLIGQNYWNGGTMGTYVENGTEYPLKTIIVEHLKITDEAYTLDVGANATQTFGFRSTNDLYAVKGEVAFGDITGDFKIRRNAD